MFPALEVGASVYEYGKDTRQSHVVTTFWNTGAGTTYEEFGKDKAVVRTMSSTFEIYKNPKFHFFFYKHFKFVYLQCHVYVHLYIVL